MRRPPENSSQETPSSSTSGSRVRGNFLKLLGGRGWSSILTLGATALMARSLSPDQFGLVILVHTYLLVMKGVMKISSFDAIIQYGVPLQDQGDRPRLAQLLRITFVLDVAAALIGTILACAIVPLIGPRLDWAESTTHLATLYSLLLLSSWTGSASGVLRLYDRFDLLARQHIVGPVVRLSGVALAWWLGVHDITPFLIAYGLGWLAQNLYLIQAGWREHRRNLSEEPLRGETWCQPGVRFPGIWRFFNVVYWQSNLDLLPKHVSVLFAGFFLGPTMAGLFRLALQFSRALAVPALLLRQVLLPDLARLWHRRDPIFNKVLTRALSASAGIGLFIAGASWLFAVPLLSLVAGPEYRDAAPAMYWLMLGAGLDMGVSTLRAAGYAMGQAHSVLILFGLAAVVYIVVFPPLTLSYGLAGAGMASAVTSILTLVAMGLLVKRSLI